MELPSVQSVGSARVSIFAPSGELGARSPATKRFDDPQRPGVLECGGCEGGRSAAPLHSRSVRSDELNFQSPRPTFASTTNLQHFPLNPLAKAKRLAYTRLNARL